MIHHKRISHRRLTFLLALMFSAAAVRPGFAATQPTDPANAPTSSVAVTLIKRLTDKGVLSKNDSVELLLLAEAEEAENRAQAAMLQAALAQAAAAQARLKAVMAVAALRHPDAAPVAVADAAEENEPLPAPRVVHRAATAKPRIVRVQPAPAPVEDPAVEETPAEAMAPEAPRVAQAPVRTRAPDAPAPAPATVAGVETNAAREAPADEVVPDDTVRVTYVPEVVKAQLREEIKQDVMAQAREENWASPRTFPEWVSKFRLFGDFRFRYEGMGYPAGNENTGDFINFNAINTGAPYDIRSVANGGNYYPTYNVDQNRNRLRLRARAGAAVDLGENFSTGLRLATGENNSPVTQNQSLGSTSGQGGNFSKYAVWLDRAFLKYETGGLPDQDFAVSVGRFDNPFFTTSMIWADDIGFDGAVAQGRFSLGEDVTPFYAIGAFPVFNTDLNFSSNQPAKFKSNDKWLYGSQLGTTFEISKDFGLKVGAAYYLFQNIEGQLSSPLTNILTAADAGPTDSSRPSFAQKGNTYMALRDIVPNANTPANGGNSGGTVNQFQYFGLASKFAVMATDVRLDFNRFEPFQISLVGEYAKNRSFDAAAIAANAVNNRGPSVTNPTTNVTTPGPFIGSDTAWLVGLNMGDVALKERWKWNLFLNYRKVGSDSLVDGFVDSDFGGGGTNVKGFTVGGNLALSAGVRLGLRWMSASEVAGSTFKNDILQLDINSKF
jgi:hypothetical protein